MSDIEESGHSPSHNFDCDIQSPDAQGPSSPQSIESPDPSDTGELENDEEVEEESKQISQEGKQHFAMEGELDFEGDDREGEKVGCRKQASKTDMDKPTDNDQEQSDEEDGQCTPDREKANGKKDESKEEDGECSDDDDLEEGELKDAKDDREGGTAQKQPARQICRFYNRGQCFYGYVCRFLHLNVDDKGNYNMFAPTPPRASYTEFGPGPGTMMGPSNMGPHGMLNHRSGPRDYMPIPPPLPPPVPAEPSPVESAWERGLKEAKELVKKANKRKTEEPDFEEKRLNLSLVVNEKNVPEFDKENDCKPYKKKRQNDGHSYKVHQPTEPYDTTEHPGRSYWKEGRYQNFEIRYNREQRGERREERAPSRSSRRPSNERDRFQKGNRNRERWRDERLQEIQERSRADVFFDPWRRSKSPKGARNRSRSGSFSSVSSYSYSEHSSRSSCSYSRSSSRSSCRSSRSPSVQQKRKVSPSAETLVPPKVNTGFGRFPPVKKKPGVRTSSSRSRSISRTPSVSRSRTYSRSISMDSVSSASSSVSHSSSRSASIERHNAHASVLRKQEENLVSHVEKDFSKGTASSLYTEMPRNKFDKAKETAALGALDDDRDPLEESFQMPLELPPFPSLQHLLPPSEKPKEPVKGLHKQQIKLTLLNKNPQSKLSTMPKKELDVIKNKPTDETSKMGAFQLGIKRPLSPPPATVTTKPTPVLAAKKSASSRRDELLKQLKAVEDAIARKRAKFC